jgi:hypothetical protein
MRVQADIPVWRPPSYCGTFQLVVPASETPLRRAPACTSLFCRTHHQTFRNRISFVVPITLTHSANHQGTRNADLNKKKLPVLNSEGVSLFRFPYRQTGLLGRSVVCATPDASPDRSRRLNDAPGSDLQGFELMRVCGDDVLVSERERDGCLSDGTLLWPFPRMRVECHCLHCDLHSPLAVSHRSITSA